MDLGRDAADRRKSIAYNRRPARVEKPFHEFMPSVPEQSSRRNNVESKLALYEGMLTSRRIVSSLYRVADERDNPDLYPVHLADDDAIAINKPGDPPRRQSIRSDGTFVSRVPPRPQRLRISYVDNPQPRHGVHRIRLWPIARTQGRQPRQPRIQAPARLPTGTRPRIHMRRRAIPNLRKYTSPRIQSSEGISGKA